MEKFSRWRDQGTGIQPFLPPVPANADHSPIEKTLTVILMIVKPITGVVKLALVSVVVLAFVLFQMAGLALAFFGSNMKLLPSDGEYLTQIVNRYNPVFTQIYLQTLTVREVTFWEALRLSGSYPELSPPEGVETWPLLDFVKAMHSKGAGPVVVFPEGTTTNNRAILKFVPIFKSCSVPETSIDITVMALKYDYYKFAPTFTVGLNNSYRFGHLFRTCAQFYNSLTVKSLASEESPSNPNFSAMDGLSSTPSGAAIGVVEPVEEDALGSVIMNLMGRLTRFRKLGLTVQDKVDFLDYFILRNNGIGSMKKISTQKATSTSALSSSRSSRSKRQ
ncbi:hypothetical protein BX616_007563 [Lobosporangium transversale]|nr:hypothetical protein BX616_007563 [Lobosporangium transversale]